MAQFLFQDKNIYYETYGTGEPILMLNGIMMSCASWKEFIEPFSANNQLILLDMLDQGKSDKMDGPFSQKLQVEVVKALLEHLSIEKVNLIGISYGGEVALQFAVKYSECLNRLVLFNTTACTGPWLGDIGNGWNCASDDPLAYYFSTIPVIYSPVFYREHNEWMQARKEVLKNVFSDRAFIESMIRLTNSAADYDVLDRLGDIRVQTLVVSCNEDYLTPAEEQKRIAERIPDCEYIVIPNCGHASMYEKPMLFTALALGFINCSKGHFNIV